MSDISVALTQINLTVEMGRNISVQFPVSLPGVGVPNGGSVGQVLTKVSANDYDSEWSNPGAASNYETYPAGENLSAGRVVVVSAGEAFYFDPMNTLYHNRAFGVTKTSASIGDDITIQPAYTVATDPAFTFSADIPLWVDSNGEIVDTIDPGWAVIQKAGVSLENDKMLIDFSTSIKVN